MPIRDGTAPHRTFRVTPLWKSVHSTENSSSDFDIWQLISIYIWWIIWHVICRIWSRKTNFRRAMQTSTKAHTHTHKTHNITITVLCCYQTVLLDAISEYIEDKIYDCNWAKYQIFVHPHSFLL